MPFSLIFLSFSKISKTLFFEFALGIYIINDLVVRKNLLFLIFNINVFVTNNYFTGIQLLKIITILQLHACTFLQIELIIKFYTSKNLNTNV